MKKGPKLVQDMAGWCEAVHQELEKATKRLDARADGLKAKDRIEAAHIQGALQLAYSLAYLDDVVGDENRRLALVKYATELKKKFHFVGVCGAASEKRPALIVPARSLIHLA